MEKKLAQRKQSRNSYLEASQLVAFLDDLAPLWKCIRLDLRIAKKAKHL